MGLLIGLGLVGLLLASLIMPWTQRSRIGALENEVARLRSQVSRLAPSASERGEDIPEKAAQPEPAFHAPAKSFSQTQPVRPKPEKRLSFEQQFGARLPVWIGGIALALAGFYMVKYSIETGLLSPAVRLAIGGLFGMGLLATAGWMRGKPDIANGTRVAQALSGAGIADLYVCLFAATSLYHLIPSFIGFAGMAAVTATAVTLSLRHGAPIALLGLVGGFLTPALVGSAEPNAPLLFIYLYFVVTGLFAVIRRKHWWWLAVPTVIGAFVWVLFWLAGSFSAGDGMWLGLFLIAVSATVVLQSNRETESAPADAGDALKIPALLHYLTLGGAIFLMGIIAARSDFGLNEWGMFGLLAAGGMGLAYFKPKIYGFVPWISMATNALMLLDWHGAEPGTFATVASAFALLYGAGGYCVLWRSRAPVLWGGLSAAASLGYYLLTYYRLHFDVSAYQAFNPEQWVAGVPVWGTLALLLSLVAVQAAKEILGKFAGSEKEKQQLLAIFAAAATAFLSIGLTIEMKREFLSVAFAAQVLAISWINMKVDIKALRAIAALLACVFGFLLLPQVLLLAQLTVYSLTEAEWHLQDSIPIVSWPLFQLGAPALMFAGGSVLLRRRADDMLVRVLEIAAVVLVGVMGYYLTRHAFHADENVLFIKAGFVERGVITNVLFLYGLACLWMGRNFGREAVFRSGMAVAGVALFRIGYFDLFIYNPLWAHQLVGSLRLLNGLLLPYGLPALWLVQANRELRKTEEIGYLRYTGACLLVLIFALVSLNVRQFYHGEYLDTGLTGNAEIYTYSVVWLLLGVALLLFGTLHKDKMVRIASLVVMTLTVGKAFLFDASELTGLFRVFSFLGLGLSLMTLSWFYTRFVFGRSES